MWTALYLLTTIDSHSDIFFLCLLFQIGLTWLGSECLSLIIITIIVPNDGNRYSTMYVLMNICLVLYLVTSLNGVFIINTLDINILAEIFMLWISHIAFIRSYLTTDLTLPHFMFQDLCLDIFWSKLNVFSLMFKIFDTKQI